MLGHERGEVDHVDAALRHVERDRRRLRERLPEAEVAARVAAFVGVRERGARGLERVGVDRGQPLELDRERDRLRGRSLIPGRARRLGEQRGAHRARERGGRAGGGRMDRACERLEHEAGVELSHVAFQKSRSLARASASSRGVGLMPDSASADSRSATRCARSSASCSARAISASSPRR